VAEDDQTYRDDNKRRQDDYAHDGSDKQGVQSLHIGSGALSVRTRSPKTKENGPITTDFGPTVLLVVSRALSSLDRLPPPLRRDRHVEVRDAERRQRVDHRIGNRRRTAVGAGLANAFGAERIERGWGHGMTHDNGWDGVG